MGVVGRTLVCIFLLLLLWALGLGLFCYRISHYILANDTKADAIVVLTGGGGRVEYGLDLLVHRRGNALFISGVSSNTKLADLIREVPVGIHELLGIATLGRITLGHAATNTIGNAEETAAWANRRDYKTILLVTADYHMPRSLSEFKTGLPNVELIPAPVSTADYSGFAWLDKPEARTLILSEYHKFIISKLRHWFIAKTGVL